MDEREDIRYSPAEERPPWELSPAGQLREWFSCRKVDNTTAGYCHEVEHQKKARARAQGHRSAAHARMQRQREEAQSRLLLEQQAAKQRMAEARERVQANPERSAETPPPPPPKDPRGDRYTYPEGQGRSLSNRRRKKKKTSPASVLLVLVAVIASTVFGYFTDRDEDAPKKPSASTLPKIELPTQEDDFDGTFGWKGDDLPWDDILPDSDEDEDLVQSTDIPRLEDAEHLTLPVESSKGLEKLSYQALYKTCLPSVVSITVYQGKSGGTGTGIVLTEDGYILTCNHVVAGGERCKVKTADDQEYDALLVGGDAQTDLAVLKIEATGLTPAVFGDSDELTVGDEVLAIGDPLGTELRGTLTNGIVSAINRNVTVKSYPMTLIQTTAALNAGNSGGPLINIYGQVVGVNNMKMISSSVTAEGLGFAVPTSVVRTILPVLCKEGKVSRPVLGITCYEIDQERAEANDMDFTGLQVASVNKASNAGKAGLQVDDVITAIDGTPVETVAQVRDYLNEVGIGAEITVTVSRPVKDDDSEDDTDAKTRWETMEITFQVMDQAELK